GLAEPATGTAREHRAAGHHRDHAAAEQHGVGQLARARQVALLDRLFATSACWLFGFFLAVFVLGHGRLRRREEGARRVRASPVPDLGPFPPERGESRRPAIWRALPCLDGGRRPMPAANAAAPPSPHRRRY